MNLSDLLILIWLIHSNFMEERLKPPCLLSPGLTGDNVKSQSHINSDCNLTCLSVLGPGDVFFLNVNRPKLACSMVVLTHDLQQQIWLNSDLLSLNKHDHFLK